MSGNPVYLQTIEPFIIIYVTNKILFAGQMISVIGKL
jgi:hypothetical protein